jgi:chromosome partitioning protein
MRTISIINLKGGVGKTVSAINIAFVLSSVYGKRVLLIDNDKQGNSTKFFKLHSYDDPSIADVLTVKGIDAATVIKNTQYSGLDVLPANMNLLRANKEVLIDTTRPQQTRLQRALKTVTENYDYCIIDNAPDINISVINALTISDDVLVPVKIDKFAFDGLEELAEQIEEVKESNERLNFAGCFVTMFQRNNVNIQGLEWLHENTQYPIFETVIRNTVKVGETTFAGQPLQEYSKGSTAARDYVALVTEYLNKAKL